MSATTIRGSQIQAGTITDTQIAAAAAIQTSKLAQGSLFLLSNGSVAMTAALNMGSHLINNVASPVSGSDATNKTYVDNLVGSGLVVKQAVAYTTTANVNLTGLTTQAGGDWTSSLTAGQRVLVKDQTTQSANGIYVAAAGAWSRAVDFQDTTTIQPNSFVFVEMGAALADSGWVLTSDPPFTIGTTALTFQQFSSAGTYTAGNGITITGGSIAINFGNGVQNSGGALALKLADSTLTVDSTGLRLSALTSGYLLIGSGSNVATAVQLSGDATVTNAGVVTVSSSLLRLANFVYGEVPTGSVNGSNTTFTIANTPSSATVQVHQNGLRLNAGAGNDYTISGSTITFVTAPYTGDVILVDYMK